MKSIFIFGLSFMLLSCGEQTDKNEKSADSTHEKGITAATDVDTTAKVQIDGIVSPNQQELSKALADPAIDDYYKEIYRQEKLVQADDNKMLSITEKLFINDPDKDLFFFIVFTKSMKGSDGSYSEAVGLSAFEFVTKKAEWFADYFNMRQC